MRLLLPLLTLLAALPLGAQEEPDAPERGIQIRGFAFSLLEGIEQLELRHEDQSVGELFLPTSQLRERTRVTSRVFSDGVTKDDVFQPFGSATLPAEGRDFILVMAPVKTGYKSFPVRTDDPESRGDESLIFNFPEFKIAVVLGDVKFQVEPWKHALLRPSIEKDATFHQATFGYEKDGSFVPFDNTRWPVNPNTKAPFSSTTTHKPTA